MRKDEPARGECWSLRSREGGPDLAPAVVLIRALHDGTWMASPLFADDRMATPHDRKLAPEPEWLRGECWCALDGTCAVSGARLHGRLGVLPDGLLAGLDAAMEGRACRLTQGAPFLPGIGDPREAFREELRAAVVHCGTLAVGEHASARFRILLDRAARTLKAFAAGAEIAPVRVPLPAFRGAADAPGATWRVAAPTGREVEIHGTRGLRGWRLAVSATQLKSVELRGAGTHVELQALGRRFVTPPGTVLPAGDYELIVDGADTLEIALEEGGPAE